MNTTVSTGPDRTDVWPGWGARAVPETGELTILDDRSVARAVYRPGDWVSVEVTA